MLLNPAAVTIFIGMIVTVVVYSALDLTGFMNKLGQFGPVLPLILILFLMVGVYLGFKQLKRRSPRIRIKGPLYIRSLMNGCLDRTCGVLEKKLKTPHLTSAMIVNDLLQDKMLFICKSDCLRFSDIRQQIEGSRLKGSDDLQLARFFQTEIHYEKQPIPDEMKQTQDTILRSRMDLKDHFERLKDAHRMLCTGNGDLISHLPPDEKKIEQIRTTYRYRPPTKEQARRMAFALETMVYLKATRHKNVNPMAHRRYDAVAAKLIPELANTLNAYKKAWQELVDAYEQPQRQRLLPAEDEKQRDASQK